MYVLVMLKTGIPTNFAALPTCAAGSLNKCGKDYFSEVAKVVKLILIMPATNLTSKRSFRGKVMAMYNNMPSSFVCFYMSINLTSERSFRG